MRWLERSRGLGAKSSAPETDTAFTRVAQLWAAERSATDAVENVSPFFLETGGPAPYRVGVSTKPTH